jgi:hypothetical protein
MGDLNTLKYNLTEILATSLSENGELVSNLSGSHVYDSSSGWGRLWTWFYFLSKPLFKDDLRLTNLRTSLQNINSVFRRELEFVISQTRVYEEYLKMRLHSNDVNEGDYHQTRRVIKTWHQTTKLLYNEKFHPLVTKLCSKYSENIPFLEKPKDSISPFYNIIKIEGKHQGPLPLDLVHKGITSQNMSSAEKKKLSKWIKGHEKVRPLHKLLLSVAPFMDNPNIVKFELDHLRNGCTLFKSPDDKHIAWRNTLKPGSKLGQYALGEQIGRKIEGFDEQIFFEIPQIPDKLVMISTNRALLAAKSAGVKEWGWALRTPQFHYIDPKGKYAIVEKFERQLTDIQWKSVHALVPEDIRIADPIAYYISWLLYQNISVTQLSPKYLMFDRDGVLRTVKIQERTYLNYPEMENFLFEVAYGNLPVFQYMMYKSGFSNTKFLYFYREVAQKALQDELPYIRSIGGNRGIIDSRDIEKATELSENLIKIRNRLIVKCNTDRETAGKILFTLYQNTCAACTLWPTLEEEAVRALQTK